MNSKSESSQSATSETATLAGGCFWCLEAVYVRVRGVTDVESGYCNGHVLRPTYEAVCSGETGHAEVVRLTYDDQVVSLRELLEIFFVVHDPTTLNRQGHDVGTQYRSGIYYLDEAQKAEAQAFVQEMAAHYPQPIATEIAAAQTFHPAEAYHQHYFANNPQAGYCQMVVAPKFLKARTRYADLWRG